MKLCVVSDNNQNYISYFQKNVDAQQKILKIPLFINAF